MTTIAEIQNAVIKLPDPEYKSFLKWFEHFEEEKWDRELESHIDSDKLSAFGEKALSEFKKGKCQKL
ncbi:MAG: hypothetical protein WCP55_06010, partial [Lentisphaerota bacterium]